MLVTDSGMTSDAAPPQRAPSSTQDAQPTRTRVGAGARWGSGGSQRQPPASSQGECLSGKHLLCTNTSPASFPSLWLPSAPHPSPRLWPGPAGAGGFHRPHPTGALPRRLALHTVNSSRDKLSLLRTRPSAAFPLTSLFQLLPDLFRKGFHLLPQTF